MGRKKERKKGRMNKRKRKTRRRCKNDVKVTLHFKKGVYSK